MLAAEASLIILIVVMVLIDCIYGCMGDTECGQRSESRRSYDLRPGHAGRRNREMGRNSNPLECTGVGGPGLVGCRHNAAHVDDAPWRGNKSDRAPLARAAAGSHSGLFSSEKPWRRFK
jgi:hypothetical protein